MKIVLGAAFCEQPLASSAGQGDLLLVRHGPELSMLIAPIGLAFCGGAAFFLSQPSIKYGRTCVGERQENSKECARDAYRQ